MSSRPLLPGRLLAVVLLWSASVAMAMAAGPTVKVEIDGLDGILHDAVKANLSLVQERGQPLFSLYRMRVLHRAASDEIRGALRPFGYYQPRISARLRETDEADTWLARYDIDPGPPVTVSELDLQILGPGAGAAVFESWREGFPLRVGDRLVHSRYESGKQDLLYLARSNGFVDATLRTHQVAVRLADHSAVVHLHLETGRRYAFGEVSFSEVPLDEALLRRFVPFAPGEPFDAERIYEFQKALADSGYFRRAEVVPARERAQDGRIPVEVRLSMRKPDRYNAGIGYGTDTGARVSVGWQRRWANAAGHSFSVDGEASDIGAEVSVDYRIPLARPGTDSLDFVVGWQEELLETRRETLSLGASVTKKAGDWLRTVGLNYQRETFEVGDEQDTASMLLPQIQWSRVKTDSRIFATHGWRLTVGAKAASDVLGSAVSLFQGRAQGKYIHSLGPGRFIARADLGGSVVSDLDQLPVSLRFFAGGDQSVRGYSYNSLGPTDSDGQVVGGRYLMVGSLEYDHYFGDRFGAAAFIDSGNAFDTDEYVLKTGVGAGLRVRLPFGVVRVDVAQAVSEPDRPWRLHVSMGPDL